METLNAKKYLFRPIPDPDGDGIVGIYLRGKSTITGDIYLLDIHMDVDAPVETWTITHFYESVVNGVKGAASFRKQVYHGKEMTDEQREMIVELVMEIDYLTFE